MNSLVLLFSLLAAAEGFDRPILTRGSGDPILAGEVIVKLDPALRGCVRLSTFTGIAGFGVPSLDALLRRFGALQISPLMRDPRPSQLAQRFGCDLQYLVRLNQDADVTEAVSELSALPEVDYACPNYCMRVVEEPDDSLFHLQWHLGKIGGPFAWGIGKGDTSVLVAVLDDGCEWHHPDIEPNLWVNRAEDINHNGRFDTLPPPDGDLDGIDQDTNGYADDVIGYDLISGDPNPAPYLSSDNHGTHCWGIANAVANNQIGVAGAAWNCRSFAFRCGGGGLISLAAAISGIYYAVPKGGWVISMSFGSYSRNQGMADACAYAWESGLIPVGGAGNDGRNQLFYPAAYDSVVSVAASDRMDLRPYWSNFGEWIDVTAPGAGIYSTVTGHEYGQMDGTSMATPLVAGSLAWVKSLYPAATNAQACSTLFAACESMPDTMYAQGLLGHGRINIGMVVMPSYRCDLRLESWRFNDASGNANGRPDPGETVALVVAYHNTAGWRDASSVWATLACSSPEVQLVKDTAGFTDIPGGASGNCSADSFVMAIPAGTPPQDLSFSLEVHATPEPAFPNSTFEVQCGEPRVLIVDDDAGSDYEKHYIAACDSNGVLFDIYSVQVSGSPSADTLRHYPVVVWFTGDDSTSTLTSADQASLTEYFSSGGKLLLSGQNIAQDLATNGFLDEYLHSEFVEDSTGKPYVVGAIGDPIMDGDTAVLAGAGGANNSRSADGIRPLAGAVGCGYYKDFPDTSVQAVIRFTGAYGLVFFSCPLEAIDHSTRYVQKWTLLARILRFFGERVPGAGERTDARLPAAPRKPLFSIRPNPVKRQAMVSLTAPVSGSMELKVFSADGRLVHSSFGLRTSPIKVDLGSLPPGVYVVQLGTFDGMWRQKGVVLR